MGTVSANGKTSRTVRPSAIMKTNSAPLPIPQDSVIAQPRRKRRRKSRSACTNGTWSEEDSHARALLSALTALNSGNVAVRLPLDWVGIAGKTADTFNEVVTLNQRMARELVRLRQSVGREGRINQRASLGEVGGTWAESVELINDLIADLVQPTSEMARVIGAVAQGDLSQTMAIEIEGRSLQGEFLRRRKARWPGEGRGCLWNLERPHGRRQLDGQQSH